MANLCDFGRMCTYDDDVGYVLFGSWKMDLKGITAKHQRIVETVTPPKIVYELIKMSVALFLLRFPLVDWKIYLGCVFIMVTAVYFSFSKRFDSADLDIEIHSIDDIDKVNFALALCVRKSLEFIAKLSVWVILVLLNFAVALLILIEFLLYLILFRLALWYCRHCLDLNGAGIGAVDDSHDLDRLANEEELASHDSVDGADGSEFSSDIAPIDPHAAHFDVENSGVIGSTDTDEITEITPLLAATHISIPNNTLSTITWNDLRSKMDHLPHRFCFITCLQGPDRQAFIDAYLHVLNTDALQYKYYDKGFIKVNTWLKIMREIDVQYHYCIYREAYWGENTGKKEISPHRVSCKAMLVEFGVDRVDTVNLLIADKHISTIAIFRRSTFVNPKRWFYDIIMGSWNT